MRHYLVFLGVAIGACGDGLGSAPVLYLEGPADAIVGQPFTVHLCKTQNVETGTVMEEPVGPLELLDREDMSNVYCLDEARGGWVLYQYTLECLDEGSAELEVWTVCEGECEDTAPIFHGVTCVAGGAPTTVTDPQDDCVDTGGTTVTCPPSIDVGEVEVTTAGDTLIVTVETTAPVGDASDEAFWVDMVTLLRFEDVVGDPTPDVYYTDVAVQINHEYLNGVPGLRVDQYVDGAWTQPPVPAGITSDEEANLVTFTIDLIDLGELVGVSDPRGEVSVVGIHRSGGAATDLIDVTGGAAF